MNAMRIRAVVTAVWAAGLAAIALYELFVVDPWTVFGEDTLPLFFRWSSQLVYSDASPFGDFVLEFQVLRFSLLLFAPIVVLWVTPTRRTH